MRASWGGVLLQCESRSFGAVTSVAGLGCSRDGETQRFHAMCQVPAAHVQPHLPGK